MGACVLPSFTLPVYATAHDKKQQLTLSALGRSRAAAQCRTVKRRALEACNASVQASDTARPKALGITRRVEQPVLPLPSHHPELHKLSLLDLIFHPGTSGPILMFFTAPLSMVGGHGGTSGEEIVRSLKSSLSQVLAIFYPMAGRLVPRSDSSAGFDISCLDQGALFSEAWADGPLSFFQPDFQCHPSFYHLTPLPFSDVPDALLYIQVTHFTCGGFCICVQERHIISDGVSLFHFMRSWIEILNGEGCVSLYPFMDLSIIGDRYKGNNLLMTSSQYAQNFSETSPLDFESQKDLTFTSKIFHFTPKFIATLRHRANLLHSPTSFECIVAYIWQNVTKVHQYSQKEKTRLAFAVDMRKRLRPCLPPGYFGNALIKASAYTKVEDLVAKQGLSHAMTIVRDATSTMRSDFLNSALDWLRKESPTPCISAPNLEGIIVSSWTRIPFGELNFPWGKPCCIRTYVHHVVPGQYVIIIPSQLGKGHLDVLVHLQSENMVKFQALLT